MQRFCLAIVLFVFLLFSGTAFTPVFAEQDAARNVSDRIKLERSEAEKEQAGAEAQKDASQKGKPKTVEQKAAEKTESEEDVQKQAATDEAIDSALNLMGKTGTLYDRKGRPDPFAPFVSGPEPSTQEETQKKLQRREPRTPLERLSLGQLQLTAVMDTGGQSVALVEEASGKGYVVKKGTYIGNEGGRVTKILSDAIVIEEKYLDVFGNVDVRKKQLKLQK